MSLTAKMSHSFFLKLANNLMPKKIYLLDLMSLSLLISAFIFWSIPSNGSLRRVTHKGSSSRACKTERALPTRLDACLAGSQIAAGQQLPAISGRHVAPSTSTHAAERGSLLPLP